MPISSESSESQKVQVKSSVFVSQARRVISGGDGPLTPRYPAWWLAFGKLLLRRVKEEQLTQVASSLTFTTVLSLVPLVTVALAIFTAFPMFQRLQVELQNYLLGSFFPTNLSNTILTYVNQFSAKAKGLTAIGIVFLVMTSLSTMLTVDRVFNQIWHVRRPRSLINKVLLYWAVLTMAPMLIGVSLSVSAALLGQTLKGLSQNDALHAVLSVVPVLCTVIAFALLYRVVPNRAVRIRDALAGGVVAALLFELGRRGFAAYITHFPSYTVVYGALAAFPVFLLWIYLSWIIVLLGAATVAALPVARTGQWKNEYRAGQRWVQGLGILSALEKARQAGRPGLTMESLQQRTQIPPDQLDDILTVLWRQGVVGLLAGSRNSERFALICDPKTQSSERVARVLWFDEALLLDWKGRLPTACERLLEFNEAFIRQPKLSDWLSE